MNSNRECPTAIKSSSDKSDKQETGKVLMNPHPTPEKTNIDLYLSVLIVARHDRRLGSLRAMLRTIPQLKIIAQADEGLAASRIIANHPPALVLLDSNLPDDKAWTILKQVKTQYPQTRCLVLIDTIEQRCIAEAAGADRVLTSEFSVAKFCAIVEELLVL